MSFHADEDCIGMNYLMHNRKEFEKLSCAELSSQSTFVETSSIEEQDENKEA